MAFTAFLAPAESGAATVLRLKDGELVRQEDSAPAPAPKLKPESSPPPQMEVAPSALYDMPFTDETGKQHQLSEFKGKLILLNLWATWCSPCVKEMPALSQLQQSYGDKGLVVLTLSQDDALEKVKLFYGKNAITNLPAYLDQKQRIFQSLGVQGLPFTMLIDATGKEVIRFSGYVDWQAKDARTMLESHLPGPASPQI